MEATGRQEPVAMPPLASLVIVTYASSASLWLARLLE